MIINFNNQFIKKEEATISMLSDSLMRGLGAFQTMRTCNKRVFRVQDHIERLLKNVEILGIKIEYNREELERMINKVAQSSSHQNQRMKIIAINEGVLITSTELNFDQEIYSKGVSCQSIQCVRGMPEVKSISYLSSLHSHNQAVAHGYYDAILIDKNKEVYECAYANLFWFEDSKVCTRSDEILEGVTRQTIIEISPFEIEYKTIKLDELKSKDEIFLTQTSKGVVPITKIDQTAFKLGEKTQKLIDLFAEYVKKNTQ